LEHPVTALHFDPVPMDGLATEGTPAHTDWLWDGYLARGNITLLTSMWKAGKTTLFAGVLRALAVGAGFLDRPCAAGQALVVSEESAAIWAARRAAIPVGANARLVSRPFAGRPTVEQWDELIVNAELERERGALDVLVVDTLAAFLPGRSESDPGTLLDMLTPLRRLAAAGAAVLVLHHPRRAASESGSAARGSGALLGFVDVILELSRVGNLGSESCRRKLSGLSRFAETPRELVYEWTPGTAEFRAVPNPLDARYLENWETVHAILKERKTAATHKELLADWPVDKLPPSPRVLYEWLGRAVAAGLAQRLGYGTRAEPFRFQLPRPKINLPDLPPLPPL
jgi:hypothetical protein